jgi:ubiquinone/menaquinone biosynthesis C-methylase UbiE
MHRLTRLIRILLMLLGLYVAIQLAVRLLRRLFPFPVPPFMSPFLDTPIHELSHPRQEILERIGLQPGLRALEVGAGPGYFSLEAARAVAPGGELTAIDVQPQMIAVLRDKVEREALDNVELRVADVKSLPFPDDSFDLIFLVTVLGTLADKGRAMREFRRVLKPDGRLSITEAMADPDYMLQGEVVGWAQTVGFELVEQHGNPFLYTLNFRCMLES